MSAGAPLLWDTRGNESEDLGRWTSCHLAKKESETKREIQGPTREDRHSADSDRAPEKGAQGPRVRKTKTLGRDALRRETGDQRG